MRIAAAALAGGLLAAMAPFSAKADWIYSFTQTASWFGPVHGETGPGAGAPRWPLPELLRTEGFFRLEDSIVRSRYDIALVNRGMPLGSAGGLADIAFETSYSRALLSATRPDWTEPSRRDPDLAGSYELRLTGTPGSLFPTGFISFNNTESDAWMRIAADGTVTGGFNTDAGGTCFTTTACGFGGFLTATHVPNGRANGFLAAQAAVPVPAPAPLALLGLGVAGMMLARPRRRGPETGQG